MDYICKLCNKNYKSYQSLWNHNKKFHQITNDNIPQISSTHPQKSSNLPPNHSIEISDEKNKKLTCQICQKVFSRSDNLKRHQLKCDKNKFEKYDQELEILKNKVKTLENKTKSTTNIKVNGNLFNGNKMDVGPKIIINKTGSENMDLLNYEEVSTIFDNEISSVIKLIELVNFSEAKPENHSFCSTALESPYLSFYNTDTNSVNKERKKYFFEEVICKSIQNHQILYSKFKNKFNSVKRKKIEDNITSLKKMKENSFNSKIMGEMIRNLNLLSYNKRDLIQETWTGKKYDNESDEEFMSMLLDDPQTQKILEENKNKEKNDVSSDESDSNTSDSEERPTLPLKTKTKSKNIIV
jgi:hypothetical protein